MWEKEWQRWECAGSGQHREQGRGGQSRGWRDSRQRLSSSEPSPQSSAPSHTQSLEMQRWLLHSNCTG